MSDQTLTLREKATVWMQVFLTVVTLSAAVFLIFFTDTGEAEKKLAAGWIGIILGFWFRP